MSAGALSNSQFYNEQRILSQGNPDDLTRSRGYQNLTSNVYRPSFSSDYTSVRSMKSPASAQPEQGDEEE
jgi:hypothetical protein